MNDGVKIIKSFKNISDLFDAVASLSQEDRLVVNKAFGIMAKMKEASKAKKKTRRKKKEKKLETHITKIIL